MSAAKRARSDKTDLSAVTFDPDRYVKLLGRIMNESEKLQNNPPQGLVPQENLCSDHVLEALKPYTGEGGPLTVERLEFRAGRGNVLIKYAGTTSESIAIVGSHMDVVPANPEAWERYPFKLSVEGDELHGRGATDCLGHVALLTELMIALAVAKPPLKHTLTALLIANEEQASDEASFGCGVEGVLETGKLDSLKSGPVVWLDCADMQPCMGTMSSVGWELKATGKRFHSGLPHKGVNSLELASEAVAELQKRFYERFPAHPSEKLYNFVTPSTMKPTQVKVAPGSLNQLPPWTEIAGDVRLTPFYEPSDLKAFLAAEVMQMNENLHELPTRGPCSKYEIEDCKGHIEIKVDHNDVLAGIACTSDSPGAKALQTATKAVLGECVPYAIGGSLPLVRDMQRKGFDVQLTGFGLMKTYHADNEFCLLSDMEKGFRILRGMIAEVEDMAHIEPPVPRVSRSNTTSW